MAKFEVTLRVNGTVFVTVEAENEADAKEIAYEEYDLAELDIDEESIEDITEVEDAEDAKEDK